MICAISIHAYRPCTAHFGSSGHVRVKMEGRYNEFTAVLIIIICIYIIKKYLNCRCRKSKQTEQINYDMPYLALKIYRTWDSIVIPLISIRYEPNIFKVISKAPVLDFQQNGCLMGQLALRWQGNLLLSIDKVTEHIDLPFSVKIPFSQRIPIWKAIRDPQTPCHGLVIVHRDKHYQISLSPQEAESCV